MASEAGQKQSWVAYRKPVPPHPFSHWVSGEEWVITSGISGHLPDGSIAEEFRTQLAGALVTLTRFLEDAQCEVCDIVAMRCIVTSRVYVDELNEGLEGFLGEVRPAGLSLLVCGLVDSRMKVEIEVIAKRGSKLTEAE